MRGGTNPSARPDWRTERDRIDLAEVATRLLGQPPGRRGVRGRLLWWRCPFHEDRNPSFCIDPAKKLWRCFGCGEHGDAASLVMRLQGATFPEALGYLTGGVEPPARAWSPPKRTLPHRTGPSARHARGGRPGPGQRGRRPVVDPRGFRGPGPPDRPPSASTPRRSAPLASGWSSNRSPFRVARGGSSSRGSKANRPTLVKLRQPDGRRSLSTGRFSEIDPSLLPWPLDVIQPGRPLVIVEGEFDALLLGQELAELAAVVTLGSASGRPNPGILGTHPGRRPLAHRDRSRTRRGTSPPPAGQPDHVEEFAPRRSLQ